MNIPTIEIVGFVSSVGGLAVTLALYLRGRRDAGQKGTRGILLFAMILIAVGVIGQIIQWAMERTR